MKGGSNRLASRFLKRMRHISALFSLIFLPLLPAAAAPVEAKLPSGTIATADYRAGQPSRPAILLLHGFLQTRHAPPMSRLADTLADQGYTVLSPTLSLGIDRRSQSLACEAVHTHTINDDVAEIGFWTNWLAGNGHKSIVLIGHSTGSKQILLYVAQQPNAAVKKAILTSLIADDSDDKERRSAIAQLKKQTSNEPPLGRFTLSYCKKNYAAPPRAFLSYVELDAGKTLGLLGKARVPLEIVLGGADATMDKGWPEKIRSRGMPVAVIENAGHFFDGEQEFDLADKVETVLKTLRK